MNIEIFETFLRDRNKYSDFIDMTNTYFSSLSYFYPTSYFEGIIREYQERFPTELYIWKRLSTEWNNIFEKEYRPYLDIKIICSAIWFKELPSPPHNVKNITKGVVLCGHRHPHIIGQIHALLNKRMCEVGEYEQGFLTDTNEFVSREVAAKIAYINEQITEPKETLYSEDIY